MHHVRSPIFQPPPPPPAPPPCGLGTLALVWLKQQQLSFAKYILPSCPGKLARWRGDEVGVAEAREGWTNPDSVSVFIVGPRLNLHGEVVEVVV